MTRALPFIAHGFAHGLAHTSTLSAKRTSRGWADICLRELLDRTSEQLGALDLSCLNGVFDELDRVRLNVGPTEWARLIADVIAPHPIRAQLHEEPFMRRAFEKPRGYAGDAMMMDLAYRDRPYCVTLTRLGAALHAWADGRPALLSVRERRTILAREIDAVAARCAGARVLSIACGHVREAQLSQAVQGRAISEFIALDQDGESLDVVEREQGELNVRVKRASVRRFVLSGDDLGDFDLVYSAGLYDYLDEKDAMAVTGAMFRSLRPGGRMLVANFTPDLRDIGCLEAIMDWHLTYRDEAALTTLAAGIPSERIAALSTTRDRFGNVVYMTIDRTRQ
jgi:extracellular factor (EF) 3-hydroxypalmitic acid methyl ester biosynthesis protein